MFTRVFAGVCALAVCGVEPAVAQGEPLDYGVVETSRVPVAPQAQTCPSPEPGPGRQLVSSGGTDVPVVAVLAPDGWTAHGATLTGPAGMSASITVTPTDLGPAQAFESYADAAQDKAPISSLSILPAELCGYSGQEFRGMWSGAGDPPVDYRDRLLHVWTEGPSYLVVVHVEGPQGAPGLDAAQELITDRVGIRLP
ncbi:hypothetical protein [Mycolicibacterium murale]|jgi:hypothetical protein|uniref:hypothetical protein n=1 Tax=Mycolicibacterium murale TaxID=182220 RepID=UPI0018751C65|nr:hypothetical protein [Mycolicibacterium murale]MCV7185840.1 hypothetical protein [Mycolicibacterium murale]